MPRIPDQLLYSIAFLYHDEQAALSGRGPGGTGFFVKVMERIFLITNIHVVGQGCQTARINLQSGDCTAITVTDWTYHPDGDDIAITEINNVREDFKLSPLDWIAVAATSERMNELNAGVGDEVFMLGRFLTVGDIDKSQPLARFGNIAMMPGPKIRDGRGLRVEAFLTEMRSLSGFSGSPTFIYIGPASYRGNGTMMPFYSESIGLIGIDTGHFTYTSPVKNGQPESRVELNSGVAIVSPVWKIAEALEELLETKVPYGQ